MDIYGEILETLRGQLQANIFLLELSKEKSDVLKENDTSRLMHISSEEEKLVRHIINLEKKRADLLVRLRGKDNTVTDIIEHISQTSPEIASTIKQVAENLKDVLRQLQLQNELNDKVMEIALEQIEFSKNVLMNTSQPSTYGKVKGNYAGEKQVPGTKFFEDKF